ncbi:hypothetical protein [uncultured Mycobacterium sp.]|uniref:hypothetical protein n=1 Tax=uncultured Mycobacterium sp. TaxID=171292 RepID=UPI0035CB6134
MTNRRFDLGNRIEINPNAVHDTDPAVYIARVGDALRIPRPGDVVTVIQPEDDPSEADYASTARVTDVDTTRGLITLVVDWEGFHEVPRILIPLDPAAGHGTFLQAVLNWSSVPEHLFVVRFDASHHFLVNEFLGTTVNAMSRVEPTGDLDPLLAPTR